MSGATALDVLILEAYINCLVYCGEENKASNVRINVTLGRVRVIKVTVEKQYVLHILSVCL